MPSPIAHIAAGYLIYRFYPHQNSILLPRRRIRVAITILFSLLPDMDIILGLLFHDLKRYHNGLTHSFFVGLILSHVVSAIVKRNHSLAFTYFFTFTLVPYELHILMDYLARGKRGVMLLWPFSRRRFRFPKKLFYGVKWNQGPTSRSHLWTIATEVALVIGSVLILRGFRKRSRDRL